MLSLKKKCPPLVRRYASVGGTGNAIIAKKRQKNRFLPIFFSRVAPKTAVPVRRRTGAGRASAIMGQNRRKPPFRRNALFISFPRG